MTHPAISAITGLADAFRSRDVERAFQCFADDPGVMYIGSEANEFAIGPESLRQLLSLLFERDEAYGWALRRVRSIPRDDLYIVGAELIGMIYRPAGTPESFPYRMSGVVRMEHGNARWLLCHAAEPAD